MKINKIYSIILFALLSILFCSEVFAGDKPEYVFEQEVILSRHNIRSPLSGPGSDLFRITPCSWIDWGVGTAHLTERGCRIEEKIGGWFRAEFPYDTYFDDNNALIYSNSKQRTRKTAEKFRNGFAGSIPLSYRFHDDIMDPVFSPVYTKMNDSLQRVILAEMNAFGGVSGTEDEPYKGILTAVSALSDDVWFMEGLIDFEDSRYAKDNGLKHLPLDGMNIFLSNSEEPGMSGGYKLVNSIADAVILQYYETGKVFGKTVSREDIRRIGRIKTVYDEVLFTNPTTAVLVSRPLVKYIKSELLKSHRKLTFLCGHDSNIASLSAALGMKMPETVDAVEHNTPVGSKIVFRKYRKDDAEFVKVDLVYASVSQLREEKPIDAVNPPVVLPIDFEGLSRNADGYYSLEDVIGRIDRALSKFDSL